MVALTQRTEVRTEVTEPNTLSALCPLWPGLRALCKMRSVKLGVKYPPSAFSAPFLTSSPPGTVPACPPRP